MHPVPGTHLYNVGVPAEKLSLLWSAAGARGDKMAGAQKRGGHGGDAMVAHVVAHVSQR